MSWIGTSATRPDALRLAAGRGQFVDDLPADRHAAIVRSPVPHGRLLGVRVPDLPPGTTVITPADVARLAAPIPVLSTMPGQQQRTIPLVDEVLRYVGQPVAVVVAPGRAAAEDAAERIGLDIEELPGVAGIAAALAEDAPQLYAGGNIAGEVHLGDPPEVLEAAIAGAAYVITRDFAVQRVLPSSLEPRGVVAEWSPALRELTAWASTQVPHLLQREAAAVLGLRVDQVRVVTPDIGGAFGGKAFPQPDELLACLAAVVVGGRVKWVETRAESVVAAPHGRGQRATATLALDADGRFTALRVRVDGDLGAYATQAGNGPFVVTGVTAVGPYRFAAAGSTVRGVYTTATPTSAYRGYGMQESAWVRERLVDEAARELGIDPVELRLRNLIRPDELPHTTRTHLVYDSGDYPAALRRAVELAEPRPSAGRVRRGVGYACSVEITGYGPTSVLRLAGNRAAGWESARVRVNEDGTVTAAAGVTALGQGVETALAQITAEHLAVPLEWVRVRLGDTASTPRSDLAAQASRSIVLAGGALVRAADRMRRRMAELAAAALDVEAVDWDGSHFHAGERRIAWAEVAELGWLGWAREAGGTIRLEEQADFDPPSEAFSYAVHGAAVAVDLDTGRVSVEDYWAVSDSGVLVNPGIAEGQIAGGIAQGIGVALREDADPGPGGVPRVSGWQDYLLPTADDVPRLRLEHRQTPSPHVPGGFKGLGESGVIPAPAAVGNAVAAAVPEIAAGLVATPFTPLRVWELLRRAGLTGDRSGTVAASPMR
ncbi:xanthine dehydrogenase family protein molybdopterin-binding subunit [Actinokineospora sp. NPDC004072]